VGTRCAVLVEGDRVMDPNVALRQIRELLRGPIKETHEGLMLSEAFDALDLWLCNGGFLPESWGRNR